MLELKEKMKTKIKWFITRLRQADIKGLISRLSRKTKLVVALILVLSIGLPIVGNMVAYDLWYVRQDTLNQARADELEGYYQTMLGNIQYIEDSLNKIKEDGMEDAPAYADYKHNLISTGQEFLGILETIKVELRLLGYEGPINWHLEK